MSEETRSSHSSRIVLSGIRARGRHGASPGERLEPQEFVVDLDVTVEVVGDRLEATVDYRELVEAVEEEVRQASFELIESLAAALADRVHRRPHVSRVTVTVHKPRAAGRLGVEDVFAQATVD